MYKEKYLKYKTKYVALKNQSDNSMYGGGNKVDIILFKADWCGHCKRFLPVWEQLKKQFQSKFNFITYDADNDKDTVDEYKVTGFPTILFKDQEHVRPYDGSRDLDDLVDILNKLEPIA